MAGLLVQPFRQGIHDVGLLAEVMMVNLTNFVQKADRWGRENQNLSLTVVAATKYCGVVVEAKYLTRAPVQSWQFSLYPEDDDKVSYYSLRGPRDDGERPLEAIVFSSEPRVLVGIALVD